MILWKEAYITVRVYCRRNTGRSFREAKAEAEIRAATAMAAINAEADARVAEAEARAAAAEASTAAAETRAAEATAATDVRAFARDDDDGRDAVK